MIAIQYTKPASGQGEAEVFGLDVAVTNFLSAWFRYGTPDKFICRPADIQSFDHFKELAKKAGHDPETKCIGLDPRTPQHNMSSITTLFRPDPLITDAVWQRQQVKGTGFAACGLVHTMSGERIARAVGELCIAPTDGTDALICPSEAIRDAVQNLWQIYADYLDHRFGTKFQCPVQTPVIPLGIDTEKFIRLTTEDKRTAQRQALNAVPDEVILLFVGRLSFATKAHPLALFLAAERVAKETGRKLRVVMYGYFKPKDMDPHFRNLAADICKTAKVEFIMNDDARFPDGLWAGADIFVSLADNIQESFGLTPIEAMAAGLPVIATDWDGYRGGVRSGQDGFLIPTSTPPASAGHAVGEYYYNQGNYGASLMGAVQSTAVDIDACAKALRVLVEDETKRKNFGANGRARAQNSYDWKHIIRAYENLWRELSDRRKASPPKSAIPSNWQAVHPAYPNPWKMFESFPSRILSRDDQLHIILDAPAIMALMHHDMNFFLPDLLMPKESMLELIEAVRGAGSPYLRDILGAFPTEEHARIWRCIGWMLKHGVGIKTSA